MKKAMALSLALCLLCLTGCAKGGVDYAGEVKEGFLYEELGISPDAVVMTVDGLDVSAEEYFYWINYGCNQLTYSMGGIDWSAQMDGVTMDEYVKSEAAQTAAFYAAIEVLAKEYDVTLSEEDLAASAEDMAGYAQYYGGMEGYEAAMARQGTSVALMEKLNEIVYLYDNLRAVFTTPDSSLYPSDDALNDYAAMVEPYRVKHILFDTRECSESEAAEKRATAEEVLQALKDDQTGDPEPLFDSYMAEYGEDPGVASNPDGYIFNNTSSLVNGFAEASLSVQEGEFTDIVETDYGYHIILRLPLENSMLVDEYFDVFLSDRATGAEIEYSDMFADISAQTYMDALVAYQAAVDAESQTAGDDQTTGGNQADTAE